GDALADEKGAREELRKAIGPTAPAGPFSVAPVDLSPPYAAVGALTELALSNRGDLRAARALYGGAEASAILARREVVPDVTFSLGLLNSAGPTSTDVLAGVSIPIPIIRRGQGTIQAASSTSAAARFDVQALETSIPSVDIRYLDVTTQLLSDLD